MSDTSSPDSASSVATSVDDSSSSSSNDSNDCDSAELNSDPPSLGGLFGFGENVESRPIMNAFCRKKNDFCTEYGGSEINLF